MPAPPEPPSPVYPTEIATNLPLLIPTSEDGVEVWLSGVGETFPQYIQAMCSDGPRQDDSGSIRENSNVGTVVALPGGISVILAKAPRLENGVVFFNLRASNEGVYAQYLHGYLATGSIFTTRE